MLDNPSPSSSRKARATLDVAVRSYVDSDFESVRAILDQGNLTHPDRDTKEGIAEKLRQDPGSVLVATLPDKSIGGCVFTVSDGWAAFIFRLGVRPDLRGDSELFGGRTLGSILMAAAEERLRSEGAIDVAILVNDSEVALKSWYERQGYVPTGAYRFMWKTF